jgi:protein-disulfide isomerase
MNETTNESVQGESVVSSEVTTPMPPAAPAQSNFDKLLMPGSVLVAGVLIAGAVIWSNGHPGSAGLAGAGGAPQAVAVDIAKVKIEGEPFIGNPNAKVTIAFWSDFQCPYCKAFEIGHEKIPISPALPDIIKNYVDTGKVKIVFRDVVYLSPRMGMDSLTGALYSRAVWKLYPEKYFEWRTAMFEAQDEEGAGFGDASSIDKLNATILGIDAVKIAADVKANTDAYTKLADETTNEAQKFSISGTPGFIIGKQTITGARPYADFDVAIKAVLK